MTPLERHTQLTRREALVLLGGAFGVAACGSTSESSTAVPSSSDAVERSSLPTSPPTTAAADQPPTSYDLGRSLWSQGNYAGVGDEIEAFDLAVRGSLPPELNGLYVRNGSNPQDPSGESHWFVGDGMVHGVRIERGEARWYRNRWVQTSVLGGDPFGSGAPGGANNTSNTSVHRLAGRLLTLEEVGFPYEIDPEDLSTIGPFDFGGGLTTAMTAHPKIDPVTGLIHFFGYGFVPPYLTYSVASPDGVITHSSVIDVPAPVMIHDFALTESDVVFWVLPVVFSLDAAVAGSSMPFTWEPDLGARIGVLPHAAPGSEIAWTEIEPCYVFHGTNAWREGDDVVLDVSRLPSAFAAPEERTITGNRLERWRLAAGKSGRTFSAEVICDRAFDLPTLSAAEVGRPHERAFYVNARNVEGGYEFGGIAAVERRSGRVDEWDPGYAYSAGEPLVVGEHVLSFVYDRAEDASTLAVFDSGAVAGGPIAEIVLPRRVPFGFHGTWVAQS